MSTGPQEPAAANPPEYCENCGTRYREGALFCEICGAVRPSVRSAPPVDHADWRTWAVRRMQYRQAPRRSMMRRTVKAVMSWMMLSVVISLVAGLVTLVYGVGIVAPDIINSPDWANGYTLFIVVPLFVDLFTLTGYGLLTYYLLIVTAILTCCAWVFLTSYRGFIKELTMKAEPRMHSPLFDISGLIFVEMFLLIVVILIAALLGIAQTETGVSGTTSELLFLLANASVWEELIVRVLMIGMPLLIVDLVMRRGNRKWWRYIFGGGFKFGVPEVVFLMISAMIFGYAHYIGGWEAWIIPWDALGGITFGYLFLRHGLASAVVLHFAIDYRGMPSEVFGVSDAYIIVLFMLWIGLGAVFTVYYIMRIGEFLSGKKYLEETPIQPVPFVQQPLPYPAAPQQWPQSPPYGQTAPAPPTRSGTPIAVVPGEYGGFVCPYCGHTEARWIDGRFQCLRCNRLS